MDIKNTKKTLNTAGAGLAVFMLVCAVCAAGFGGVYTYKFVLRNILEVDLNGAQTSGPTLDMGTETGT